MKHKKDLKDSAMMANFYLSTAEVAGYSKEFVTLCKMFLYLYEKTEVGTEEKKKRKTKKEFLSWYKSKVRKGRKNAFDKKRT